MNNSHIFGRVSDHTRHKHGLVYIDRSLYLTVMCSQHASFKTGLNQMLMNYCYYYYYLDFIQVVITANKQSYLYCQIQAIN